MNRIQDNSILTPPQKALLSADTLAAFYRSHAQQLIKISLTNNQK